MYEEVKCREEVMPAAQSRVWGAGTRLSTSVENGQPIDTMKVFMERDGERACYFSTRLGVSGGRGGADPNGQGCS